MKAAKLAILLVLSALMLAAGYQELAATNEALADDDASDDDTTDDDSVDDDSADDDTVDWWDGPDCTGYGYPECETSLNVPPELLGVDLLVDGKPKPMPASVSLSSELKLAIRFRYPGCDLTGGHVFVVKDDETICLNGDGLPVDGITPEIPHQCAADEEPYLHKVDPSLFVDSTATYSLEISNACATHSDALPLQIEIQADDDGDDDSGGCGC